MKYTHNLRKQNNRYLASAFQLSDPILLLWPVNSREENGHEPAVSGDSATFGVHLHVSITGCLLSHSTCPYCLRSGRFDCVGLI